MTLVLCDDTYCKYNIDGLCKEKKIDIVMEYDGKHCCNRELR